ncbi:MAG: HTH domain-containing protein [Propionibacteriaceae bacterium]|jgi:mannitol operon transcriptional antiterminator|nr:HTH domain-containing protein [Propionibacteriaceae bacterium]
MITKRQASLLTELLASETPLPAAWLAARLGVSRRTVFRELEPLTSSLADFSVSLEAVPGQGFRLIGLPDALERLSSECSAILVPQDKLPELLELLLESDAPRPLSWFASRLQVGDAAALLKRAEQRLAGFGLTVERKPGAGVRVDGLELGWRQALGSCVIGVGRPGSGSGDGNGDGVTVPAELAQAASWMTTESVEQLYRYILASVRRVHEGKTIAEGRGIARFAEQAVEISALYPELASQGELEALTLILAASRRNDREGVDDPRMRAWAFRLIEAFDAELAPLLKLDDDLVDGLTLHLSPLLVRVKNHIELPDVLGKGLAESYPELVARTAAASRVLCELPPAELSFLATHFGAALSRLDLSSGRMAYVGVMCLSGIGSSYMLATGLRQRFGARARFEICEPGCDYGVFDMLVSTVPIEAAVPVVQVGPILDAESAVRVDAALGDTMASPSATAAQLLQSRSTQSRLLLDDIDAIISGFTAASVDPDESIEKLFGIAGKMFGQSADAQLQIAKALAAREQQSTQVIPELGIALLHCAAPVDKPAFALINPQSGEFTSAKLQGIKAAVVMLIPSHSERARTELMGRISSALILDERFLGAIRAQDEATVKNLLQRLLHDFLEQQK